MNPDDRESARSLRAAAAAALRLEFGRCERLCYGLSDGADSAGTPLPAMQLRLEQALRDAVRAGGPPPARLLLVGDSLAPLAREMAGGPGRVSLCMTERPDTDGPGAPAGVEVLRGGFPGADLEPGVDQIVIEGSVRHRDLLPWLCRARGLLADGGLLHMCGEFVADDSKIGYSDLPAAGYADRLAGLLGFGLAAELDFTAGARDSLARCAALLDARREGVTARTGLDAAALDGCRALLGRMLDEFEGGRRCFRLLSLRKLPAPAGGPGPMEYGVKGSFDPMELAGLYRESFDAEFDPALWRWKYVLGGGDAVVARDRGGEVVCHFGGVPRKVEYFGAPSMAMQGCDVMVSGRMRRGGGPFFDTAALFIDREVGNAVRCPLSLGFPNRRLMRVAVRLGLYRKIDDFVELAYGAPGGAGPSWTAAPLDVSDPAHRRELDALWRAMRGDCGDAVIGVRDADYVRYRYFDHPGAAAGLYDCRLLRDAAGTARAAVVSRRHDGSRLLMDIIGPLGGMGEAVDQLCRLRDALPEPLKIWISGGWRGRVARPHAVENELEIEIPCSVRAPGPGPKELYGRWWITAGDMDCM